MEIFDAIRNRRAMRDYKPEAIPEEIIQQVITAASWAPSAMNEQPWHFTVVADRKLMGDMSARAKSWLLKSVDTLHRPGHFAEVLADPHFNIFYNAPLLAVISAPAQNQWYIEDCALAAENAMLAAVGLGLGSCWIGFAQAWLNSEAGLAALGLPQHSRVVAPIIFGYPKTQSPPVARKNPAIDWIGGNTMTQENLPAAEFPGVHGTLIHP